MNPSPYSEYTHSTCIHVPQLSDREIAVLVNQTWICAACGHREHSTDPDLLRAKAKAHAREHGEEEVGT